MRETEKRFDNLNSRAFGKGFHSPANQKKLSDISGKVIQPRKGKLSAVCREIEHSDDFKEARRKHSAVDSSVNALENHGLDRCPDHGIEGFKRYIGLAVLSRDIQSLGHVIQQKKLKVRRPGKKNRCRSRKRKVKKQHVVAKMQGGRPQLS